MVIFSLLKVGFRKVYFIIFVIKLFFLSIFQQWTFSFYFEFLFSNNVSIFSKKIITNFVSKFFNTNFLCFLDLCSHVLARNFYLLFILNLIFLTPIFLSPFCCSKFFNTFFYSYYFIIQTSHKYIFLKKLCNVGMRNQRSEQMVWVRGPEPKTKDNGMGQKQNYGNTFWSQIDRTRANLQAAVN